MLKVEKFVRRSFDVDVVRVTEDNMEEVARWCGGDVRKNKEDKKYIKVRVVRPLNARQSEAYVNDVVLYAGTGYKVYTPRAFEDCFMPSSSPPSLWPGDGELLAEAPLESKAEQNVLDPFPAQPAEEPFNDPRTVIPSKS